MGVRGFWAAVGLLLFQPLATAQVLPEKSIMITDHRVLNRIADRFDFGFLLGEAAVFGQEVEGPTRQQYNGKKRTPGTYVESAFSSIFAQQKRHNNSPAYARLAAPHKNDRMMDAVFRNWMPANKLAAIKNPAGLRGGPFRLLAVANLMDVAGDMNQSTASVNQSPKALGEMHFVYGLVDKDFEKSKKKPFPQTFVLAYRVPPIKLVNNQYQVDKKTTMHELMTNTAKWRAQMAMWAELWADLSNYGINSSDYESRLRRILNLITGPENFAAMRSNAEVNNGEFELREWYVLQASQMLIEKKLRNEPFRCLAKSRELTRMINDFWDPARKDLDMVMYNPNREKLVGYHIFRDTIDWFQFDRTAPDPRYFETCGSGPNRMPFEMESDVDDDGNRGRNRLIIMPPFGRTTASFVWKLDSSLSEAKRHAFAIRTCSGCHGPEGAAKGFHIQPRLANEDSKLSPFLTGTGQNTFSHGGKTYRYNILQTRKDWLERARSGQINLYESLLRPEVAH